LKDVFLDRIGIALNADSEPLTMEDRVLAVSQVQSIVIKYSTREYNAVLHHAMHYYTIQLQHNAIQYNTIQINTVQCNTVQHNTM
jgi:hypothetical protein